MNDLYSYEEWQAAFADELKEAEQCDDVPFTEEALRMYYAEYLEYQRAYRGGYDL